MRALERIEDPLACRERLMLPKFILTAAGHQFFPTDSARHYFERWPGVSHLRAVPNAGHAMKGTDAMSTLATCYDAVLKGAPLPRFAWTPEGEAVVRVTAEADGSWLGRVERPERGWTVYFVELTLASTAEAPFSFTTVPRVFPDLLPHSWEDRAPPAER